MFRRRLAPTILGPDSLPLRAIGLQYFNANHPTQYSAAAVDSSFRVFVMPSIVEATRQRATSATSSKKKSKINASAVSGTRSSYIAKNSRSPSAKGRTASEGKKGAKSSPLETAEKNNCKKALSASKRNNNNSNDDEGEMSTNKNKNTHIVENVKYCKTPRLSHFDHFKSRIAASLAQKMSKLPERNEAKQVWNDVLAQDPMKVVDCCFADLEEGQAQPDHQKQEASATKLENLLLKQRFPDLLSQPDREKQKGAVTNLAFFLVTQKSHALPAETAERAAAVVINVIFKCFAEATPNMTLRQIYVAQAGWMLDFKVLASSQLLSATKFRHDASSCFSIMTRRHCNVAEEISLTWKYHSGRAVFLFGSSGSGKTCFALDVAQSYSPNSIIFVLDANSLGDIGSQSENRDSVLRRRLLFQCSELMNRVKTDSLENHAPCNFDNLVRMNEPSTHVFFIVDDCGSKPQILRGLTSIALELSIELHKKIFDDTATRSLTMQGYTSPRVHFIAAGSGVNYATHSAGSKGRYFETFYLDSLLHPSSSDQHLQGTRYGVYDLIVSCNEWSNEERHFLKRLSPRWCGDDSQARTIFGVGPNVNRLLSLAEEQMKKVVTNSRAAATFLTKARWSPVNDNRRMWAASLPAFQQFVDSSIVDVSASYMNNSKGLARLKNPVTTLAHATAFALHRFPFAPLTLRRSHILREAAKSPDEIDKALAAVTLNTNGRKYADFTTRTQVPDDTDVDVYNFLCTTGGVLVDYGDKMSWAEWTREMEITDFVPESVPPVIRRSDDEETTHRRFFIDPVKNSSRFQLPVAQAAMAVASAGLPVHRSSSHWSGTEHLAADICTVLAGSSRAVENFYDAVNAEMKHFCGGRTMEDYHKMQNSRPEFYDPLHRLKQLLRFGRSVLGAQYLRLHSSSIVGQTGDLMSNSRSTPLEAFIKSHYYAKIRAAKLYESLVHELATNKNAVVLRSPDMEEFADLVVVGPGRVILIQCKANVEEEEEENKINFLEELLKMRVLDGDSFPQFEQQKIHQIKPKDPRNDSQGVPIPPELRRARFGNIFREMWLAAILHAAGNAPATGPSSFNVWMKRSESRYESQATFDQALCNATLLGTCPANVQLHVVFFVQSEQATLEAVRHAFGKTLHVKDGKPIEARGLNPFPLVKKKEAANETMSFEFRSDIGLESVELVSFARGSAYSAYALSPFTASSVLKPKEATDLEATWKFSTQILSSCDKSATEENTTNHVRK